MKQKKILLGQFFTKKNIWLQSHISDFIFKSRCNIIYDPFAGKGDLLEISRELGFSKTIGLDIDENLGWRYNDSLESIPHIDGAIIITNPPYLSNYSASRKKIIHSLQKYFNKSMYDDIYLIALDRMLEAQNYVIAIIPETFINSNFKNKDKLFSITILEKNPFEDTTTPVVVACFDGKRKEEDKIKVYKNDCYIGSLRGVNELRLNPKNLIKMKFNDKSGWLGLRAIDLTEPKNMICFDHKSKISYDWENGIKVSSRLYSLIDIDIEYSKRNDFIRKSNKILFDLRESTQDIILSPFKGNMKNGIRRRRLDFKTARAILERAYIQMKDNKDVTKQYTLF